MCIPNTVGHELDIKKNDNCVYFSKTELSAFSSLEFKDYLQNNKITKLYISGFLAEYCVRMTAIDAIKNNFEVVFLKDCIGTGDDVQYQLSNLFDEVINLGGVISDFKTVLNN
jgi:nicotinamidase/pyrazinamidase